MITLYHWNARSVANLGHVALELLSKGRIYISWYPVDFSLAIVGVPFGGSVQSSPHLNLQEDIRAKGQPNHTRVVYGLSETAILDFWRVWNQHNRYRLYNHSCATTVAEALTTGGGDKYAPQYVKTLMGRRTVWTPGLVCEYALAINRAQNI